MARYVKHRLPEHISHSQVSTFLDCGEKYRYSYIEGIPYPSTPSLLVGQAYHRTLEAAMKHRQQWLTTDIGELAEAAWTNVVQEAENSPGGIDWQEADQLDLYKQVVALTELWWDKIGCEVFPAAIERRFEIKVPDVPVPFVGIIDLITDEGIVIDHKTASRAWSASKVDKDLQSTAYLYAIWRMTGTFTNQLRFDVAVKTAKPQIISYIAERTKEQLLWYEKLLGSAWAAIKAGIFVPNPTGWLCSPAYCSYWPQCMGGVAQDGF